MLLYEPIGLYIIESKINNYYFIIVGDIVPVLRAIIEVTDWYNLGLKLGIPHHQLERIRRDGYDENDHRRNMISAWLETGHASWSSLVDALKSPLKTPLIKTEVEVAEQIIKAHPRKYDVAIGI